MNVLKAAYCLYAGHDWDESAGMHGRPLVGSHCVRCGKWNYVQSEA